MVNWHEQLLIKQACFNDVSLQKKVGGIRTTSGSNEKDITWIDGKNLLIGDMLIFMRSRLASMCFPS